MKLFFYSLFIGGLFFSLSLFGEPAVWPDSLNTVEKADYLTQAEKAVIVEMNKARTNPKMYAGFLRSERVYYNNGLIEKPGQVSRQTQEGVEAVDECIDFMDKAPAMGLLRPSKELTKAAADHTKDQSKTGQTGHIGNDKSTFDKRILRYYKGEYWMMSENISYGFSDASDIVMQLMVDDGVPLRGHRDNIMNPSLLLAGVSINTHPVYGYMCVITYLTPVAK